MADIKKNTPSKTATTVTAKPAAAGKTTSAQKQPVRERKLVFERENYMLFFTGIFLIIVGYICMAGGHTDNPNEFHPDQIFAWRRINLAPTLVLLGFGVEVVAIMYRRKKKAD